MLVELSIGYFRIATPGTVPAAVVKMLSLKRQTPPTSVHSRTKTGSGPPGIPVAR